MASYREMGDDPNDPNDPLEGLAFGDFLVMDDPVVTALPAESFLPGKSPACPTNDTQITVLATTETGTVPVKG